MEWRAHLSRWIQILPLLITVLKLKNVRIDHLSLLFVKYDSIDVKVTSSYDIHVIRLDEPRKIKCYYFLTVPSFRLYFFRTLVSYRPLSKSLDFFSDFYHKLSLPLTTIFYLFNLHIYMGPFSSNNSILHDIFRSNDGRFP